MQILKETTPNQWRNKTISLPPRCLISLSTLYPINLLFIGKKILAKNEEIYDEQFRRSTSVTVYEHISDTSEDGDNRNTRSMRRRVGLYDQRCKEPKMLGAISGRGVRTPVRFLEKCIWPCLDSPLVTFHNLFSSEWLRMFEFSPQLHGHSWLVIEKWSSLCLELRVSRLCTIFSSTFTYFITKGHLSEELLLNVDNILGCAFCPRHFTSKNDNLVVQSPNLFLSYMCLHSYFSICSQPYDLGRISDDSCHHL